MSKAALCRVHRVDVLSESIVPGASMGQKRVYSLAGSLSCRMVPMAANTAQQLGLVGQLMPHQMWTATDPGITERNRIRWKGTILRLSGVPSDQHGQGRIWITNLVAKTEDNAGNVEIV